MDKKVKANKYFLEFSFFFFLGVGRIRKQLITRGGGEAGDKSVV